MAIGVFDSGLGGLTILSALRRRLPEQAFVYLGDNANAPIGGRSAQDILDITIAATEALFARGCRLVILACNTASAVALRPMQEFWVPADRRVLGVFVPVIEALAGRGWADRGPPIVGQARKVALFATPATVASGAFQRELNLRITGTDVLGQPCPGLVDALETGDAALVEDLVAGAVSTLLQQTEQPDAAVLGCTHYPLAQALFARHLPTGTPILSQGDLVADALADYLRRHPHFSQPGKATYLTSGDPAHVGAQAQTLTGHTYPFTAL
ncbi:glutamate racemase [Halovulum sp. GXIMD14793]